MAQKVGDLDIFHREAGPRDAPTLLLLHGFPTSSQMCRNLIPALADQYHIVAPDYPGYGYRSTPPHDQCAYTFDNLVSDGGNPLRMRDGQSVSNRCAAVLHVERILRQPERRGEAVDHCRQHDRRGTLRAGDRQRHCRGAHARIPRHACREEVARALVPQIRAHSFVHNPEGFPLEDTENGPNSGRG